MEKKPAVDKKVALQHLSGEWSPMAATCKSTDVSSAIGKLSSVYGLLITLHISIREGLSVITLL